MAEVAVLDIGQFTKTKPIRLDKGITETIAEFMKVRS
jgi:hypothetical protein